MVANSDGSLSVGTEGAGLYRFENGKLTQDPISSGLGSKTVWILKHDRKGNLWIGTGDAWTALNSQGNIRHYDIRDGLTDRAVIFSV